MKIRLTLKEEMLTIVDPEDYEFLQQWSWSYKRSERKYKYALYARRAKGVYENGKRVKTISIYMHHVILERMGLPRPSKKHTADHINCNSLDNRRDNLRWATKKEQRKNQRRCK